MGIINDRKDFIGGTDAIRIMNGQWVDLYQEKLGIVEPEDLSGSLPVQLGVHTEQFNLDWWTTRHQPGYNMAGTRVRMQFGLGSGDLNAMHGVPMFGTADMMCIDSQNKSYLVEAKHTNSFTNMEGVLERYMPQLQFYMFLHKNFCQSEGFKDDGIYLSVIFGNSKWESKHISYDHAYTMNMISLIVKFWRHVQAKMPPSNRDAETPDISSIAIDRKVKLDMNESNEFMSDAHDYVDTLASAKKNESAKKRLLSHIPPDVYAMDCDLLTVSITDKRRTIKVKETA